MVGWSFDVAESHTCVNVKRSQCNSSIRLDHSAVVTCNLRLTFIPFPTQATRIPWHIRITASDHGGVLHGNPTLVNVQSKYRKLNDLFWKLETSLLLEGGGMPGEGISSCGNRLKSFNSCDLGSLLVFYAVCVLIFFRSDCKHKTFILNPAREVECEKRLL